MTKRRLSSTLAAICAFGLIALVALASSATAGSRSSRDAYIDFRMPSNNIFCAYMSSSSPHYIQLRCDILSGLKPLPSSRGCVEGSRSESISMGPAGRAGYPCTSDSVVNKSSRKLNYGQTWRHGGFACTSRMSGLTCRNRNGHGFFMSRAHSYPF